MRQHKIKAERSYRKHRVKNGKPSNVFLNRLRDGVDIQRIDPTPLAYLWEVMYDGRLEIGRPDHTHVRLANADHQTAVSIDLWIRDVADEMGGSVILFYKELLSGYTRRPFAGFFIGDLYGFAVGLEAPANGCGFLRPLK